MELRNTHPAFGLDGIISVETEGDRLVITRSCGKYSIALDANLTNYNFEIK